MQRCSKDRQLNQARSKPDTVDRPVRTARIFVHHYSSTQYCNTDSFFSVFPFLRTKEIVRRDAVFGAEYLVQVEEEVVAINIRDDVVQRLDVELAGDVRQVQYH